MCILGSKGESLSLPSFPLPSLLPYLPSLLSIPSLLFSFLYSNCYVNVLNVTPRLQLWNLVCLC